MVNKNNLIYSEGALNYFLIQTFSSILILFTINIFSINLYLYVNFNINNIIKIIIIIILILKIGMPPFHFWLPNLIENINWFINLIIITWQKFAPLIIISYFINTRIIIIIFIITSTIVGAIAGLNQTSMKKIINYSSINHLGWIFIAIILNENIWILYFTLYSLLIFSITYICNIFNISYLIQLYLIFINYYIIKFLLLTSIISLGGLPPFLGFLIKWLIIKVITQLNYHLINIFIILISLITLSYYLKIIFSATIFNYIELNWSFKIINKNNKIIYTTKITFLSLFKLITFTIIIYIIN